MDAGQERGYYKMISNTTQLTYVTDPSFADVDGLAIPMLLAKCALLVTLSLRPPYIPLQFWFNCNPGLALPLIALQYHEVKINLDLRPIDECLWAVSSLSWAESSGSSAKVSTAYNQSLVAASLYVDYIYLDTDERRRMAQNLTSTSSLSSSSLVMNLLALHLTRLSSTSTTLSRNSSGCTA